VRTFPVFFSRYTLFPLTFRENSIKSALSLIASGLENTQLSIAIRK
jgi:hypothetical protein